MGTEIAISCSSLRAQLENEKSSLFKIDENIKKFVQTSGRFVNDRFNVTGDYSRGGLRLGGRNSYPEAGVNYKNDDTFNKRKHETKTVFSRLSARSQDSDGEDEVGAKRARVPSAVTRELPTRAAVLRAQGDDEQARKRNRRIFGSLLGTLQKFKQEEIVLQTKEDKKALVERKIEEQARVQKEKEHKERKTLFAEREHKKATIKALEAKMARVQEFEKWESSQKCLENFVLTKAKPHVYWLPKKMSDKANEKLIASRKYHEKCMENKRHELQEELQRIEQRCLRPRPGLIRADRENRAGPPGAPPGDGPPGAPAPVTGRARDKFARGQDEDDTDDERPAAEPELAPAPAPEPEPEDEPEPETNEVDVVMDIKEKVEDSSENMEEEPKPTQEKSMDTDEVKVIEPSTEEETVKDEDKEMEAEVKVEEEEKKVEEEAMVEDKDKSEHS